MSYNMLEVEQPIYYYRNFEQEIRKEEEESSYSKRLISTALPFIALYRPAGKLLSISMDALRVWSSIGEIQHSISQGNINSIARDYLQLAIAVISLSATIYCLPCGLLITTSYDVCLHTLKIGQAIMEGDKDEFLKNLGGLANSGLYLVMLSTNSVAIAAFSLALQVGLEAYKTYQESQKENVQYIELMGHLFMTGVRAYQLNSQYNLIKVQSQLESQKTDSAKEEEVSSHLEEEIVHASERCAVSEEYLNNLNQAIKRGDLNGFTQLQQSSEWNNLTNEDLGRLSYSLINQLNYDDKDKNQAYLSMFDFVNFRHPNRVYTSDLGRGHLFKACQFGNVEFFEYIVNKPIIASNLTDSDIVGCMEHVHHSWSYPGMIDPVDAEQRANIGKTQILRLAMKLPQWNSSSTEFTQQMVELLLGGGYIPHEIRKDAIKTFENSLGWRNLNKDNIMRILSSRSVDFLTEDRAIMSTFIFDLVISHPAYNQLTSNDLSQVAQRIAMGHTNPGRTKEELMRLSALEVLMKHDQWNKMLPTELVKIVNKDLENVGFGRGNILKMISNHPNWNEISDYDFAGIIFDYYHMCNFSCNAEVSSLLKQHPCWPKMQIEQIAELAEMAANRSKVNLIRELTSHPNWKHLRRKDILEVLRWSYWIQEISEVVEIFSRLDSWKEITRGDLERFRLGHLHDQIQQRSNDSRTLQGA